METKKTPFFIKLKNAIFNFDEYTNFAMEKLSTAIKYFILLLLISSLCITIAFTYKSYILASDVAKTLENDFPNFSFKNNQLIFETEEEKIYEGNVRVIVNPKDVNDEAIKQDGSVVVLKDKILINYLGLNETITYAQMAEEINLNDITKETVIKYLRSNEMLNIYFVVAATAMIMMFGLLVFDILIDVAILSLLGFLVSRVFRVSLKYKPVFIMAIYAITLSVILRVIYLVINTLTGFEIQYFDMAYDAISYIYMITAILMIKSDLIKQQMELMKLERVQKQIEQEVQEEKKKEEEDKVGADDPVHPSEKKEIPKEKKEKKPKTKRRTRRKQSMRGAKNERRQKKER